MMRIISPRLASRKAELLAKPFRLFCAAVAPAPVHPLETSISRTYSPESEALWRIATNTSIR